jgi:hypothetical protein
MKKEVINIKDIPKGNLSFNHVVKAGNTLYLTS